MKKISAATIFLFSLMAFLPAFANSTTMNVSMYVYDNVNGEARDGDHEVTRCVANAAGTCLTTSVTEVMTFDHGIINMTFDLSEIISSLPSELYARITMGESVFHTELNAVPFAARASVCDTLAAGITIPSDAVFAGAVGDITEVVAGTGLAGGGTSGAVTLNVDVGTTAGKILQLDSSAKIPAVDGSNLTGVIPADATVSTAKLADSAVTSAKIANGTIAAADIAAGAVDTTHIGDQVIATADLADSSVTTAKIADGTIVAADIASDAVEAAEIATGAVTTTEVLDGTIAAGDVGNDALDFAQLADFMTMDAATTINSTDNSLIFQMGGAAQFSVTDAAGNVHMNISTGTETISFGSTTEPGNLAIFTPATLALNLSNVQRTERLCHNGADGATGLQSIADCNAAGQADIAEYYGSDGLLGAGDLVVPKDEAYETEKTRNNILTSKAFVMRSSSPYETKIIGVVSTNPFTEVLGEGVFNPSEHPVPVALVGRVPVKVTNENGPVRAGDFLTSSSTPGYAMKATRAGQVIGIALSSLKEGKGKVVVFLQPGYHDPAPQKTRLTGMGGEIVVSQGEKELQVYFTQSFSQVPRISITPRGNPQTFFWVSDVTEGGFVLSLAQEAHNPIPFEWLAVESEE